MDEDQQLQTYELWRSDDGVDLRDDFFGADNSRARELLLPSARLIWTVDAASWNEAQQKRYDFMGWGHYLTIEEDEAEREAG